MAISYKSKILASDLNDKIVKVNIDPVTKLIKYTDLSFFTGKAKNGEIDLRPEGTFEIALDGKTYWFCMPDMTERYWAWYDTLCGTSTSTADYAGASNTAAVLAKGVPTDYTPNIWEALLAYRTSTGFDDWFVPSYAELRYAKNNGAPSDWFIISVWTSSEHESTMTWYYDSDSRVWSYHRKNLKCYVVFARSF